MSAGFPDVLYVRSVWTPSLCGAYRSVAGREVDSHPVWKNEDGQGWIFSKSGRWCVTQTEAGKDADDDLFLSTAHGGRSPAEVQHLGWRFRASLDFSIEDAHHREEIGFVVSELVSPKLPRWAEQTIAWAKEGYSGTKQEQWRRACETIGALEKELVARATKQDACGSGCVAACFPDLEIQVGDARILANTDALVRASPFFAAMLKEGGEMQEAATGQVRFPTADPQVIRNLLSLIYSQGSALIALRLTVSEQIDVLAQAAEWECNDVVNALLDSLPELMATTESGTALRVLKLASLQREASSFRYEWSCVFRKATERVAETCRGELGDLIDLPCYSLECVLRSDKLDTVNDEGRVLRFIVDWVQKDEDRLNHLPKLLNCVRFPFIRLLSLSDEEKVAMRFVHDHASEHLRKHISDATSIQVGVKRGGQMLSGNAKKRQCCGALPEFDAAQLSNVLCQSLFSTKAS